MLKVSIYHSISGSSIRELIPVYLDTLDWRIKLNLPRVVKSRDRFQLMRRFSQPWIARSRRLLSSLDDLEREARTDMSRMPVRCNVIQSFDWSEEKLQHSLNRAQQAHVSRNKSSKEFRNARITDDSDENPYWYWRLYKRRCHWRHKWDQFLRSNLDWDWSPAHCFKWMFDAKGNR